MQPLTPRHRGLCGFFRLRWRYPLSWSHSHNKAPRGTPGSRATGPHFQVSTQVIHTQDLVEGYPKKPTLPTSSVGLFQEVRMEAKTERKAKTADCKGAGGRG